MKYKCLSLLNSFYFIMKIKDRKNIQSQITDFLDENIPMNYTDYTLLYKNLGDAVLIVLSKEDIKQNKCRYVSPVLYYFYKNKKRNFLIQEDNDLFLVKTENKKIIGVEILDAKNDSLQKHDFSTDKDLKNSFTCDIRINRFYNLNKNVLDYKPQKKSPYLLYFFLLVISIIFFLFNLYKTFYRDKNNLDISDGISEESVNEESYEFPLFNILKCLQEWNEYLLVKKFNISSSDFTIEGVCKNSFLLYETLLNNCKFSKGQIEYINLLSNKNEDFKISYSFKNPGRVNFNKTQRQKIEDYKSIISYFNGSKFVPEKTLFLEKNILDLQFNLKEKDVNDFINDLSPLETLVNKGFVENFSVFSKNDFIFVDLKLNMVIFDKNLSLGFNNDFIFTKNIFKTEHSLNEKPSDIFFLNKHTDENKKTENPSELPKNIDEVLDENNAILNNEETEIINENENVAQEIIFISKIISEKDGVVFWIKDNGIYKRLENCELLEEDKNYIVFNSGTQNITAKKIRKTNEY